MTKKFGDHKYDKFISTALPHMGKYVIQEKNAPFKLTYPQSIKDARDLISYNDKGYLPATSIGGYNKTPKPVGVQARPAAAPAPKAHVPKPGKKPVLKAVPAPAAKPASNVWPFPNPTPAPVAPSPRIVRFNNVSYEVFPGVEVEFVNYGHIKIKPAP